MNRSIFGFLVSLAASVFLVAITDGAHAQMVLVSNLTSGTVQEYTTSGTLVGTFASGLAQAADIAVSGSDVFVADGGAIMEYTTSGAPVGTGTFASGLNQPNITISGTTLFATTEDGVLREFPVAGGSSVVLVSGLDGVALGDLTVSGSDIFMTDYNKVIEYTTSGVPVGTGTFLSQQPAGMVGITTSGSDVFISRKDGTILEYTVAGTPVGTGTLVSYDSSAYPNSVAVFGSDLFVTNAFRNTVSEFTTSGTPVGTGTFISSGLNLPVGIAFISVPEPGIRSLLFTGLCPLLLLWSAPLRRRLRKIEYPTPGNKPRHFQPARSIWMLPPSD